MCLLLKTSSSNNSHSYVSIFIFYSLRFSSEMHRYFFASYENTASTVASRRASISPVQSSSNTDPSPTSRTYRSITRTNTNNTVGFSRPWFLITRRNHGVNRSRARKHVNRGTQALISVDAPRCARWVMKIDEIIGAEAWRGTRVGAEQ